MAAVGGLTLVFAFRFGWQRLRNWYKEYLLKQLRLSHLSAIEKLDRRLDALGPDHAAEIEEERAALLRAKRTRTNRLEEEMKISYFRVPELAFIHLLPFLSNSLNDFVKDNCITHKIAQRQAKKKKGAWAPTLKIEEKKMDVVKFFKRYSAVCKQKGCLPIDPKTDPAGFKKILEARQNEPL